MNKYIKWSLVLLIPCTISSVVGWKLGSLQGGGTSQIHQASKSIFLVNELVLLREGKVDELIKLKERELDSSLLVHSLFLEKDQGWMIYPLNEMNRSNLENAQVISTDYRQRYTGNLHRDKRQQYKDIYQRVDALLVGVKQ